MPALDGLRGVGIAVVIGVHYFGYPIGGYFSMDMFFALSGFLITTLLLEERDRSGGIALRAFYGRRAYRLLPALFAVLAAFAILTGATSKALEQLAGGGLYAANIVMASGSHLLDGTPLTAFWSLAQEEQFYFIWPIVLILLLKRGVRESRIAAVLVGLVVVLAVYRGALALDGASMARIYAGPDTHADGLVLGCLFAFVRRQGFRVPQLAGWAALAAFVVAFVVCPPTVGPIAFGLLPMSIAGILLVGAALEPGLLGRCFSLRPVVWLGMISYSVYLWHSVVFWLLDWRNPVVALPITLVVSAISYYVVERPFRKGFRAKSAKPEQARPARAAQAQDRPRAKEARVPAWAPKGVFAMRISGR